MQEIILKEEVDKENRYQELYQIFLNPKVIDNWDIETLFFKMKDFYSLTKNLDFFKNKVNTIFCKCGLLDNLYCYYVLFFLFQNSSFMGNLLAYLKEKMSIAAMFFIKNIFNTVLNKNDFSKEYLNTVLERKFSQYSTESLASLLLEISSISQIHSFLFEKHPIALSLIEEYKSFDPTVTNETMYRGASIIGKLVQSHYDWEIYRYFEILHHISTSSKRQTTMIGGGSYSLVYRVGDYVIKIGEDRMERKMYQHHRILNSEIRFAHLNHDGIVEYYVEVMRYAIMDATLEERDELKEALLRDGLVWSDDKLCNCGRLVDGDFNIPNLNVDYVEVAGRIENKFAEESFQKRKRRIVVIDNDSIVRDYRRNIK